MRILHLVLFSHDKEQIYVRMMHLTRQFYQKYQQHQQNHHIETYYYYYDADIKVPVLDKDNNFLRFPGSETYIPGILDKTIEAFKYFFASATSTDETKHTAVQEPFDFVVRSNASTLINFEVLLPTLESRKQDAYKMPLYAGPLLQTAVNVGPEHGVVDKQDLPINFITGTCIILNHFTVTYLIKHSHELQRSLVDDLSIALFFKKKTLSSKTDFSPKQIAYQFLGMSPHTNISHVSAFRNQNYMDREQNVKALQEQVQCLTQRYFEIPKKPIKYVLYHDKDITPFVLVLCKESITHKWFINGNDNHRLDDLFGDPKPMQLKMLHLHFEDGTSFSQAFTWCFAYDFVSKKLMVQ